MLDRPQSLAPFITPELVPVAPRCFEALHIVLDMSDKSPRLVWTMSYPKDINAIVLEGKTLSSVVNVDDTITFETTEGKRYQMWHSQDCCESVSIYDITGGTLDDLIGVPITHVEEDITSEEWPDDVPQSNGYNGKSWTWSVFTFTLGNSKTIVVRWLGSSNGYYSESVSFCDVSA